MVWHLTGNMQLSEQMFTLTNIDQNVWYHMGNKATIDFHEKNALVNVINK